MNFNKNSLPINSTAKRVVQKGIHYDFKTNQGVHSDVPHKNRVKTRVLKASLKDPSFEDFTDHRHGSFTVQRYVGHGWSCKCVCGEYEIRTTKSIKKHIKLKGQIDEDMCDSCADLKRIRNKSSARAMGYSYREYMERFSPRRIKIKSHLEES